MKTLKNIILFSSLIGLLSCNSQEKKEVVNKKPDTKALENCVTSSSLIGKSDTYKPKNIENTFLTDEQFEEVIKNSMVNKVKIDSSVIYVTHPSFQRNVVLTKKCFNDKDNIGIFLMKELFVSDFIYDEVKLIDSSNKNILNFGRANVLEFEIKGGSEYNPHYITLFLKENTENYLGFSISSDGMRWKKISAELYLPLFVERVRINKQYEIPLFYSNQQFNPIGHHKIPELWNEN